MMLYRKFQHRGHEKEGIYVKPQDLEASLNLVPNLGTKLSTIHSSSISVS